MADKQPKNLPDLRDFAIARGAEALLAMPIAEFITTHDVTINAARCLEQVMAVGLASTVGDLSEPAPARVLWSLLQRRDKRRLLRDLGDAVRSTADARELQVLTSRGAAGEPVLTPGMSQALLIRWARARQVKPWLKLSLERVLEDRVHAWYHGQGDLGGLICARPSQRPYSYIFTPGALARAQRRAIALVMAAAADLERGQAEEPARLAAREPPAAPVLRGAWQHLEQTRRVLRASVPPLPATDASGSHSVFLLDDPPGMMCKPEGNIPCLETDEGGRVVLYRDDEERWCFDCACPKGRDKPCITRLAALDRFMDVLGLPELAEARATLLAELGRPGWDRALERLLGSMDMTGDEAGLVADGQPARFVWRVVVDSGVDLDVRLEPALARPRKTGKGVVVRKLAMARARELRGRLPRAVDQQVLDLLALAHSMPGYARQETAHQLRLRALRLLVDHPDVYSGKGGARLIRVQQQVAALSARQADDKLQIGLQVGDEEITARALLDLLWEDEDAALRWSHKDHVLTVLDVPPAVRKAARHLADMPVRLPLEAAPALVQRFAPLVRAGEVRFDAGVLGEPVTTATRPGVELRMSAGRLAVSLYVLPLPEGASAVPGEGQVLWMALRDGQVVHTERDLEAESLAAEALWRQLDLPPPTGPLSVVLADMNAALALVDRLADAESQIPSRWDGEQLRSLGEVGADALRLSVQEGRDWFELRGELRLEGATVPLEMLLAAVRERQRYVRIEGRGWVKLNRRLRRHLAAWADGEATARMNALAAPALLSLQDEGAEVDGPARWLDLADRVRQAAAMAPGLPDGLNAELRPYQVQGYEWLVRLAHWAPGAVLADDMGLGKTVQALALMLERAERGPALVVAPTSVTFNWLREVQRFAPSLDVRPLRSKRDMGVLDGLGAGGVVLTSWAMATRQVEALSGRRWTTLVLDEAQAIKNAATRRSRAITRLQADFTVALTGTPLENRTGELWSLMRVVTPGLLGSGKAFRDRFALPIERHKDATAAAALAALIAPFVLRRLKSEVATELPPRTEIRVDITLSPAERRQYDQLRRSVLAATEAAKKGEGDQGLRFQLLAALTRLRQLACHPGLLEPQTDLKSAKLEVLRGLLEQLRAEGHRALVFSQFTSLLALVRQALEADGLRCLQLDGSVPGRRRKALVDAFQGGEADVFLLSIKAGGVGLNLTAASYVFHLDPWWNPAVEDQATDRAHRIGQDKPVNIYRLVARGTVEEAIYQMHRDKRDLVDAVLAGTGRASAMSVQELHRLVAISAGAAPDEDVIELEKVDLTPADVDPTPAIGLLAGVSEPAPAATDVAEAMVRVNATLQQAVDDGRLARQASAGGYRVKIERLLGWMSAQGRPLSAESLRRSEADYGAALAEGTWPAPKSDQTFIPAVVRWAAEGLGEGL